MPSRALDRTGNRPLSVTGLDAATITTPPLGGKWPRAYELRLILTDRGGAAVALRFVSDHDMEPPFAWAWASDDVGQLVALVSAWVRDHNPADLLLGFPPAAQFDRKRDHLGARLKGALGAALSDLWSHLPGAGSDA